MISQVLLLSKSVMSYNLSWLIQYSAL